MSYAFNNLSAALNDGAFTLALDELDLEYCFYSLHPKCRKEFIDALWDEPEAVTALQKWLKFKRVEADAAVTHSNWEYEYEIVAPHVIKMFDILLTLNYKTLSEKTYTGAFEITDGKMFDTPLQTINLKLELEDGKDPKISIAFFTKDFYFIEFTTKAGFRHLIDRDTNEVIADRLLGNLISQLNELLFELVQLD